MFSLSSEYEHLGLNIKKFLPVSVLVSVFLGTHVFTRFHPQTDPVLTSGWPEGQRTG